MGLLDDTEFICTRLTASVRDILRRSQIVDIDADEGPAFTVDVWGVFLGCIPSEGV